MPISEAEIRVVRESLRMVRQHLAPASEAPAELGFEIADLAHAHAGVGVRAAHFAPMGVALMVTLAETLGEDYTPDLQAAWHAAYDHFAALMIARGGFE